MDVLVSFLILFDCCIVAALLSKVPFLIRAFRKKESIDVKELGIGIGLNAGFDFLFCLFVFLFMLLFNQPVWYRAVFLYGTLSLLLCSLRIGERIFAFVKNKKIDKTEGIRVFGTLGVTLLALALDAFCFNHAALKSDRTTIDVSPTSSYVTKVEGFKLVDGAFKAASNRAYIVVSNLPEDTLYATFDFESANAEISFDIAVPQSSGWRTVQTYTFNASKPEYCRMSLVEKSTSYLLTFNAETTRSYNVRDYVLKGIHFNQAIPYNYSLLRGLLVIFVCYVATKIPGYARKNADPVRKTGRIKLCLAGGFLLCFLAVLITGLVSTKAQDSLFVTYPLSKSGYTNYDIFIKLFDAFKKGQLHLDYEPDPKLVALGEDAYVPAARSAAHASVLWDHAYFNGKYYCYFGAAPVIFISFPVYVITGGLVPTGLFLLWVGFFAAIFGFAYLAVVLLEIGGRKVNPIALVAILIGLAFGGLFLNLVVFRQTDFMYRVPFTLGLANAILFTAFTLEAYRGFHRRTFLGLAGFFFVLIIGTRPDFGVWLLFLSPLFLSMLFRKEKPMSKRLLDFAPMAGILLVGALVICGYNYARYGTPLEFGQTYQMTSMDVRTIKLDLGDFRGAFYHYFLQYPSTRNSFGYINTTYSVMPFDSHPYRNGTIGLLNTPIPYFWLSLIPCFLKEKRLEWRFAYVLMPVAVMGIAWSIYGLGGTCFRYMLAIYPLSSVIALFAVLRFFSFDWNVSTKQVVGFGVLGGCVLCFVFGANLVPSTFDGMRGEDLYGIVYYGLRDILGAYNTL